MGRGKKILCSLNAQVAQIGGGCYALFQFEASVKRWYGHVAGSGKFFERNDSLQVFLDEHDRLVGDNTRAMIRVSFRIHGD